MAKPNYKHAKRQKELSRKTKQQERLQRRSARLDEQVKDPTAEPARPAGLGNSDANGDSKP